MKFQNRHQQPLAAYLDGEVSGLERLRIANHLAQCESCATDAVEWREIGDLLRVTAAAEPLPVGLDGLAGGVISRVRAERSQSWRATMARAFEDWHWFAVAAGSLSAAFVSTLIVSLLLQFGPTPHRDDSLAALLTNLESPAGTLFLLGTQGPTGKSTSVFMQFDDGSGNRTLPIMPATLNAPNDLVSELSQTLSSHGPLDSTALHPKDRLRAESLLDQINRWHFNDTARPAAPLTISQFLFVTSVGVSAKGI
jgi:hypothetical protein